MEIVRHGLRVGIDRVDDVFYLNFKIVGKLTHKDYQVMVPMLESAIEGVKHPEIKSIVDIRELEGWELRAAWDDFQLGLKHGREFSKVAIVGNKTWEKLMAKVGGWFVSGEVKYFEDFKEALDWLKK